MAPDERADGKPRVRCLACLHCRHTADCLPPHGPAFARSRRCLTTATRKPNKPCAISTKSTPLRSPRSSPSKTPAKSAINPQRVRWAEYRKARSQYGVYARCPGIVLVQYDSAAYMRHHNASHHSTPHPAKFGRKRKHKQRNCVNRPSRSAFRNPEAQRRRNRRSTQPRQRTKGTAPSVDLLSAKTQLHSRTQRPLLPRAACWHKTEGVLHLTS